MICSAAGAECGTLPDGCGATLNCGTCSTGICGANEPNQCGSATPECGNGKVEPGELCDGNCPTTCNDGDGCTTDVMTGTPDKCDVKCANNFCSSNLCLTQTCCTAICGDVNQNGGLDVGDPIAAVNISQGATPTACQSHDGDVLADSKISARDANAIQRMILDLASNTCQPCARICGDTNNDGNLNVGDLVGIENAIASPPSDVCLHWAADVDGDNDILLADSDMLQKYILGTVSALNCVP